MKVKMKVGDKFNKLTIIELLPKSKCNTQCECGNIVYGSLRSSIVAQRLKSCGKGVCYKRKNLLGLRFGKLEVIGYTDNKDKILVKCDCGKEVVKLMWEITVKKRTVSCGIGLCSKTRKDLTGKQFGYLTTLGIAYKEGDKSETFWECLCVCGNKKILPSKRLMYGHVKSCGCLSSQMTAQNTARKPNEIRANGEFINRYKASAKERGLTFSLSFEEVCVFTSSPCFYCGAEKSNSRKFTKRFTFLYNGIDRKDNSRGYETDNCVTCCKSCNYAKREMSVKEFIEKARLIVDKFKDVDLDSL